MEKHTTDFKRESRAMIVTVLTVFLLFNGIGCSTYKQVQYDIAAASKLKVDSATSIVNLLTYNDLVVFRSMIYGNQYPEYRFLIFQHKILDYDTLIDYSTRGMYTLTNSNRGHERYEAGVWRLSNDTLLLFPDIYLYPDTITRRIITDQISENNIDAVPRCYKVGSNGLYNITDLSWHFYKEASRGGKIVPTRICEPRFDQPDYTVFRFEKKQ